MASGTKPVGGLLVATTRHPNYNHPLHLNQIPNQQHQLQMQQQQQQQLQHQPHPDYPSPATCSSTASTIGSSGGFPPPPPSVIRSSNLDQTMIMSRSMGGGGSRDGVCGRSVSGSVPPALGGGAPNEMSLMMDMLFPENENGGGNGVGLPGSNNAPPRLIKSTLNPLASMASPMDYHHDGNSGGNTPMDSPGSSNMSIQTPKSHHPTQPRLLAQFTSGGPATWSQGSYNNPSNKASSLLDSHDRFKPERNNQRRPLARMKWAGGGGSVGVSGPNGGRWGSNIAGDLFSCSSISPGSITPMSSSGGGGVGEMIASAYFGQFNQSGGSQFQRLPLESESRVSSMTIADISPRIAVKKVLLLYEHAQYNEAANFIDRLSVTTFRIILRELPIDIFIDAMPLSFPILESLYSKVFASEGTGGNLRALKPYTVLMHIVNFFSRDDTHQQCRSERPSDQFLQLLSECKKILRVMVLGEPRLIKTLQQRAKALDKAVEGMGHHSLVGTSDESLLPLHDALKLEFRRVVDTYKEALQKLEELALSAKNMPKSLAHGPAPVAASHQRQLSLRVDEIQDRLIKNKSLLNVVEPTLDNNCLDILLGILQRRIDLDKDALFQFTQLRKEAGEGSNTDAIVAPLLMRYSRASKKVLEIMREAATEAGTCLDDFEDESSDLSGYHSDSDSAIMTSGNSPYVTPRARYNFLSRSVRSKQHLRPSLLGSSVSSGHSQSGRSLSTGSAPDSSTGSALSSLDSGSLSTNDIRHQLYKNHLLQQHHQALRAGPPISGNNNNNTPTRPRHVKHKNQLQKHSSVASDSCSSRSSAGSSSPENNRYHTESPRTNGAGDNSPTDSGNNNDGSLDVINEKKDADTISLLSGCVECVTLVSVPDNQVITQGVNHRCAIPSHAKANDTVNQLRGEVSQLKNELRLAKYRIAQFQTGGGNGFGQQQQQDAGPVLAGGDFEKRQVGVLMKQSTLLVESQEDRKQFLIREYSALYAQGRVETMDALDSLPDLSEADELKSKLLFSVIVLAFRAVQTSLAEIKDQVSNLLQLENSCGQDPNLTVSASASPSTPNTNGTSTASPPELQECQQRLVQALSEYLHHSQQKVDQSRCVEVVSNQLWTTLYDYPCLKSCQSLLKYIRTSVNLAWGLSNLNPPCILEYENKSFSRDMHVRFHSSDTNSENIKTYLWPSLMEGNPGTCVHKGVVIT